MYWKRHPTDANRQSLACAHAAWMWRARRALAPVESLPHTQRPCCHAWRQVEHPAQAAKRPWTCTSGEQAMTQQLAACMLACRHVHACRVWAEYGGMPNPAASGSLLYGNGAGLAAAVAADLADAGVGIASVAGLPVRALQQRLHHLQSTADQGWVLV